LDKDYMVRETRDNLSIGGLQLLQAEKGYRYSLDPILLAHFVALKPGDQVVDLGTGCGIIPLLLATLNEVGPLIGIERQASLVKRAVRNVELNGYSDRITILPEDIRQIKTLLSAESADVVVTNPPYRRPGTGHIAPNDERAAARHELAGGMREFVAAAKWLLKNGGTFAVVYLAERLPELMVTMVEAGIEPKRLRMIHSRHGEAAKLLMLEGRKGSRPGLAIEKPLYVYCESTGRNYSNEVLAMYK
jgi:tRNA1Val (adenine37-N6)-methyltransferase